MSYPTPESERDGHSGPAGRGAPAELATDPSKVMVIGRSGINRVVVSKIVERSGLKPVSETPEAAAKLLQSLIPGAVVLDGGADNRDCDGLMSAIAALRRVAGKPLPAVILLSIRSGTRESLGLSSIVDEVVAKPITTERLQPVIDRLVGHGRS